MRQGRLYMWIMLLFMAAVACGGAAMAQWDVARTVATDQLVLYATADATVNSARPTTNYGAEATLQVQSGARVLQHSTMRFGLRENLPAGAIVDSARLELYLLATPYNRRAAPRLAGADLSLEEPLPPAAPAEPPNIFALYEENIGAITPLIADDLKDAEERYPPQWIEAAFREAVSLNKRSWRYVHSILRRWEAEGPDYEEAGRDPEAERLERRYARGKRGVSRLR